jgi:desulfoferrodoxin (superoxide reductase-like protein)
MLRHYHAFEHWIQWILFVASSEIVSGKKIMFVMRISSLEISCKY